jgi:LuxR family transcriptional regulator, maltose regulon positive regulatory protein
VAKTSAEPAAPRLDPGWRELQEGQWEAARATFERAVDAAGTPEAFEGLSWAAWWLDDGDTVFDARERAYRLYKDEGDVAGAARMATWLASDQLDFHGAFAVAGGWVARAHRLLDPLEPGPEHGWLAFLEGYMAHAAGETEKAAKLGRRSAELGRRLAVPDLEMLGLAIEGASLVVSARVAEGMRYLDEAVAVALQGEAEVPISGAWACCFLVSACTAARDYSRASEWCDRIAEFAERYGSRYMLAFCRAEYGAVNVWRGQWDVAEAVLEASIEDFLFSRPAMVGGPLVGLAELRRLQGRPNDAAELLDRAGSSPRAQLCRARLVLDRGDTGRAADLARRLLRKLPRERELDRAPGLEVLIRALTARGDLEEADSALADLRDIEGAVGSESLRAAVDLAEGQIAAARGDHERARTLLEDAVDRFERSGAAFETAHARIELATSLAGLGRGDVAKDEATAARDQLLELGAEDEAKRASRLLAGAARSSDAGPPLPELTRREREVLRHVAEGLTNRQIAERLVVSEHTVHRHVTNILRKLELPSRTAAAALAARLELLGEIHT